MKNNRTFLEKLLDGAKVEWRTIDEVSNKVSSGGTPATSNNSYYENGNIPWLRTQEVDFKEIWDTDIKITEEGLNNSSAKWIPKNCVIVAMYGATVGKIAINKIPLTTNQACANIEVNPEIAHYRYVFHYLMSKYEYIKSLGSGSQTNINSQIVKKIRIPIPPLSVQTEIVKILDALTALTSELTSELTLRRKQYEYYREKLLSEEELGKVGGEWKNLKDVLINLRTGLNPRNNFKLNTDGAESYYITVRELDSVNIKITDKTDKISNQAREIIDKRSKLNIGDILFSGTGTIGKTAFISELPRNWNIKEGVYALTVNQEIIKPMYLLRLLQSEITKKQINNFVMGSTVKSISMADLKKVKILIPSLEEQQRIVSILDKFETLTNSITEGLPLAIEQSQKRYEYYRELLLSFS